MWFVLFCGEGVEMFKWIAVLIYQKSVVELKHVEEQVYEVVRVSGLHMVVGCRLNRSYLKNGVW